MAKSLIINCYLEQSRIKELYEAVKRFSKCEVVGYKELNVGYRVSEDMDAVIISGSEARIVEPSDREKFEGTISLIKDFKIPLFGICYGYQLLSWSFGAEVASLSKLVKRFEKVRTIEVDEIFDGFKKEELVPLAESHYDYVKKDSLEKAGFVLLADSSSCEVEAVRHRVKPFYGVQFHPERIKINDTMHPEGHRIIQNFYKNVVKR